MKYAAYLFIFAVFISCSSAPPNTGDVIALRTQAEKEIGLGNQEAGRGNYDTAGALLAEAKRKAVLADDWSLIIRASLSLGNVLFTAGREDEAFAQWNEAVSLAEKLGNRELLAVSRIYHARGRLLSGKDTPSNVLGEAVRESAGLRSDSLYAAFSWQVRALALLEERSFSEAENAARRSLDIHMKARYLENAAFDWYLIASIRSQAGNTQGALQALQSSIELDRRTENSYGLASAWRAIGDVQRRAGNNNAALDAYRHSKAIFEALGNIREAAEIDRRINQ